MTQTAQTTAAPIPLPIYEFSGSLAEIGEAFGECCREQIRELYDIRLQRARVVARESGRRFSPERVLEICRDCVAVTREYDPEGFEEFAGIGRGAGLSEEQVFALHGLTDLQDVLALSPLPEGEGCSSFMVAPDRSATGQLLLGQNWDLQTSNMPFVCLVNRRPNSGPETWALTVTGGLTLIGLNSEGIAVGNTNLRTSDARVGTQYLTVLHRALRSASLAEAVDAVRSAPRAGAHYYYLGGPDGAACGLECSATRSVSFEITSGTFVHCNHCLDGELAQLEAFEKGPSTCHRQNRLTQLLNDHTDRIAINDLKHMLSDHEGGEDQCLCRHDFDGASTNACVIMSPGTREINACRGQPHLGQWVTRTL